MSVRVWQCTCGRLNSFTRDSCWDCGSPHTGGSPQEQITPTDETSAAIPKREPLWKVKVPEGWELVECDSLSCLQGTRLESFGPCPICNGHKFHMRRKDVENG
jgi:hypothetical protein